MNTTAQYLSCIAFGTSYPKLSQKLQCWKVCEPMIRIYIGNVLATSDLYITPPWGNVAKNDFCNAAWMVQSIYPPYEQLQRLLKIEDSFQRTRKLKWDDRSLDLDILWSTHTLKSPSIIQSPALTLPHHGLIRRAFMWIPFSQLWNRIVTTKLYSPTTEQLQHIQKLTARSQKYQPSWRSPFYKRKILQNQVSSYIL